MALSKIWYLEGNNYQYTSVKMKLAGFISLYIPEKLSPFITNHYHLYSSSGSEATPQQTGEDKGLVAIMVWLVWTVYI